jgi:hypothetical protein
MNNSAAAKRPNEPLFMVVIVEHPLGRDIFCPRENYSSEVLSYSDINIKVLVPIQLRFRQQSVSQSEHSELGFVD